MIKEHVAAFEAAARRREDSGLGWISATSPATASWTSADRTPPTARRRPDSAATSTTLSTRRLGSCTRSRGRGYRFPEETMRRLQAEDRIIHPKDARRLVQLKKYLRELRPPLRGVIEPGSRGGAADLSVFSPPRLRAFRTRSRRR